MSSIIRNTRKLAGKTVFISGASRGIGKEIALKVAKDGANIVIASKTVNPHPKLEGTIYTVAKEVESLGAKCLPVQMDLRNEEQVDSAIKKTIDKFGGLDILVNNASAISLTKTEATDMKKYDLMHQINIRGTFLASKLAIPHLKQSENPHILNLSPPLVMKPIWFKNHVAYTIAKYGMSMCVLGMASELKPDGIAVNALWPKTLIWTAAVNMLQGNAMSDFARKGTIMGDAAYVILTKDAKTNTGNFYIDETVLKEAGVTDFNEYAMKPGNKLTPDYFLPDEYYTDDFNLNFLYKDSIKKTSQSKATSKSDKVFAAFEKAISDEMKNDINSVLSFEISGKTWYVDILESKPLKISNTENNKPDVTLITDETTFVNMAKGNMNPTSAFMTGKLKIKGNMAIAMKVEKLFKKIKTSL